MADIFIATAERFEHSAIFIHPNTEEERGRMVDLIREKIGAVVLNGAHDRRIRLGETVAVFGLGTLGQIVAQAARASGARVIAVDVLDARLEMAKALGADIVLNPKRVKVAEEIKRITEVHGADVVFEVAGSKVAVTLAAHDNALLFFGPTPIPPPLSDGGGPGWGSAPEHLP